MEHLARIGYNLPTTGARRSAGARKTARRPGGQMLVEFSLVVLLLIAVGFGVLDLSRVLNTSVVLTNAAREGARFGTQHPSDTAGVRSAVRNEAASSNVIITDAQIGVICTDANGDSRCDAGHPIRVTINYDLDLIFGNLFSASPITVTRFAEMMVP